MCMTLYTVESGIEMTFSEQEDLDIRITYCPWDSECLYLLLTNDQGGGKCNITAVVFPTQISSVLSFLSFPSRSFVQ